jgi:hypothetical protein
VTSAQILDGSISASKLQTDSVTNDKIPNSSIDFAKVSNTFRGDLLESTQLTWSRTLYSDVINGPYGPSDGNAARIAGASYARSITGRYGAGIDAYELTVSCPPGAKNFVYASATIIPRTVAGVHSQAAIIECASNYFTFTSVDHEYKRFSMVASRNTCGTLVGPNTGDMAMQIDLVCAK